MTLHVDPAADETSAQLDAAWEGFREDLGRAAQIIHRDSAAAEDPTLRATGYRYLLNLLNAGLEQELFSADPDYPEVGRLQDNTKRYASESPDCLFGHCALDPSGTYLVTGSAGSAHYVGLTLYSTIRVDEGFDEDDPNSDIFKTATGSTLGAISAPGGLELGPDGSFELTISATPHDGNWLEMDSRTTRLMARQYFYDWENEAAHHISVRRLDHVGEGPVHDPVTVTDQVTRVGSFVNGFAKFWDFLLRSKRDNLHNTLRLRPPVSASYAGDAGYIAYGAGHLVLEEDEAAIISFHPPECHFWNLHLSDYWGQSLDYTFRQTSLNGHQARPDDTGLVTVVVSHRDPGVANWLDTAGQRDLPVTFRWWLSPSKDLPTPDLRVVKAVEVEEHVPSATPRISAQERAAELESRRAAVLRRYQR